MKPDISVIMSVYNGETYLAEAIESVRKQTFQNWELIIINDCSTDSTGEILADFSLRDERIRVHTNEVNLKLPASLNKAISLSNGKYIARMDADDESVSDVLWPHQADC
jgi:glycosyltransferase involved in cell wall biosynthesis